MKHIIWVLLFPISILAQSTLRVSEKYPRYFEYQGKPLILLGSGEHYGAVLNPDFDYQQYLNTIAAEGLNYTRIFTGQYAESYDPGTFGILKNTLGPAKGRLLTPYLRSNEQGYVFGGNKFDLTQWDENYWSRLRAFVAAAEQKGIIVEITLFTALYSDEGWKSSPLCAESNINATENVGKDSAFVLKNEQILAFQTAFVQRIAHELHAFDNVLYEIQNEPWADAGVPGIPVQQHDSIAPPSAVGWQKSADYANPDRMAWQMYIAQVLHDAEQVLSKQHLIARNHCNFRSRIDTPDTLVAVYNFHYAHPDAVYDNLHLNRPICCDETGFNGSLDAPYRLQAWRFFMAGGAMFDHLDYSFTVAHPDGTDQQDAPGSGSVALRRQFALMRRFLEAARAWEMKPSRHLIKKISTGHKAEMLMTPNTKRIVVFAEGPKKPLNMAIQLLGGTYTITQYDPITLEKTFVMKQQADKYGLLVVHLEGFGGEAVLEINH
jgi:Cellulase (glycosyl hydrolase family 5)